MWNEEDSLRHELEHHKGRSQKLARDLCEQANRHREDRESILALVKLAKKGHLDAGAAFAAIESIVQ